MAGLQGFLLGINLLGAVLLHFLWQGAALALIYLLLRPLCFSVGARYRLGMAMLLGLALCPPLTMFWLWPVAGVPAHGGLAVISGAVVAMAGQIVPAWDYHQLLPWFVALWLCGVVTIGTRSLWQWQQLARLLRQASAPPAMWGARLARLRERFGLRRPVRLLCSARAVTPLLVGWIKPVILLPASMLSGFEPQQIELIIAHELGHVLRRDYLANLFQVVVETVLFYHPVVHWISRDVRNAREECCDDLVLNLAKGNPLTYARALTGLEELRLELDLAAPALGAGGGVLLARVRRIVGVAQTLEPLPRSPGWPLLLAVVAMVCLAWRPHVVPKLDTALASVPAQALAVVSGNLHLMQTPAAVSVAASARQPDAPTPTAPKVVQPTTAVPVPAERVRIERSRVGIAVPALLVPVGNIVAHVPSIPVATAAVTNEKIVDAAIAAVAPLRVVAPIYPSRAMEAGIQGNVEMAFGVDATGAVRDIRVVHAQPTGVFEAAAKAALLQWHFPAAQASAGLTQNFAFTLRSDAAHTASVPCQLLTGSNICRRAEE